MLIIPTITEVCALFCTELIISVVQNINNVAALLGIATIISVATTIISVDATIISVVRAITEVASVAAVVNTPLCVT